MRQTWRVGSAGTIALPCSVDGRTGKPGAVAENIQVSTRGFAAVISDGSGGASSGNGRPVRGRADIVGAASDIATAGSSSISIAISSSAPTAAIAAATAGVDVRETTLDGVPAAIGCLRSASEPMPPSGRVDARCGNSVRT